jgi:phospholipase/lecithinase/hemolysin
MFAIKSRHVARWIFIGCLGLALSLPAAAQTSFKKIVVFGTSLSDAGNAFVLRGGTNTPPDYDVDPLLVPDAPYAKGGHHFSNGATWIEQYARPLGLASSVRPALRGSSTGATNYAVGAARAYEDGINFNLPRQVATFLEDFGGRAPGDALYVIEMGGNDIRDAMVAYLGTLQATGDPDKAMEAAGGVLTKALQSIGENIFALWSSGARRFLVWNAPDLSLTPAIQRLERASPGAALLAASLSAGFNSGLLGERGVLASLAGLPDIELTVLDVYTKVYEIVGNAAGFGFSNVNTACITPSVAPFHCQNFDEYLFWDGIHPTKATHAIIAQFAAATLAR